MRLAILISGLCLVAVAALAEPVRYELDRARSSFGFAVTLGPERVQGEIPVRAAQIVLDLADPANSRIRVSVDSRKAVARFALATPALRGPKLLAAQDYPTITFQSRKVRAKGDGATVSGDITIRGVTRPITFDAQTYRQRGQDAGDLSRLTVHLTGELPRSAFGADGWSGVIGEMVTLDVVVRVHRAE